VTARGPRFALRVAAVIGVTTSVACLEGHEGRRASELIEVDRPTARVDLLFVIDNSGSMADEQARLAAVVPRLVEHLAARGVSDLRLAVTGPDVMCDPAAVPGMVARGRFATRPMPAANFTGRVGVSLACRDDDDCAAGACDLLGCRDDAQARWRCETAPRDLCVELPNGSFGTRCTLVCDDDEGCVAALGPGFVCLVTPSFARACVAPLPPCPAEIPPVLAGADLALAPCAMRIGVFKEPCARFEQPLEAMRLALDPAGPNAAQHAFVRPDAVLAVVAVSDEEDCSTRPGETFLETDAERCGVLEPADGVARLQSIDHYVGFLEGLKGPGRAFFAAIAGDSAAVDPGAAAAEREAYLATMRSPRDCYTQASICTTPDGRDTARWAPRLFAMAAALAPDGLTHNACDDDWASAVVRLADALADTATRVCLPRALPSGAGALGVTRLVDGRERRLTAVADGAAPGTWRWSRAAPECASGAAILVADPPVAGERLRFVVPVP